MVPDMDRGLYVAATGMLAEMDRQNNLSNNLANLSTPGYKADYTTQRQFAQLLWNNRSNGQDIGAWGVGPVTSSVSNMNQGALQQTGNKYDLAIEGNGFFEVRTPQGVRYTRNGAFTVNAQGNLVNAQGYQVLSTTGAALKVGGGNNFQVNTDGNVFRDGVLVGRIAVVNLNNPQKVDGSLWNGQAGGQAAGSLVRQSQLEDSNTNPINTIVEITASQRAFDAGQRVLRSIDDNLAIAAKIAQVS